jgi:PKD repeat protein
METGIPLRNLIHRAKVSKEISIFAVTKHSPFMKKIFGIASLIASLLVPALSFAQNAGNDTASFPYWIQMMQDPGANFFKTQRAFNIYWKDRQITRGCGWKVFKRWEYMMQSRINPDGSIPSPDATFNALYSSRFPSSQAGNWISLGPAQIPAPGPAGYEGLGRLNTVSFHPTDPNKLYVGAPSGGFWYSNDAGNTWTTTTDTLPTLGVSSIIVDYSNTSSILIGTGDRDAGDAPGMGVFKSTNGGLAWAPWKTGMGNVTVGNMLQHPSNPLIMLAATSGGVYRSTDGGANWTKSKSGDFKDIKFKPGDPNTVYAATGPNFFRSTDNGVTFTQVTSGLPGGQRAVIGVSAANSSYVYLLVSNSSSGFLGLYRSADAGLNFTARSTSPNILDWSCDGSGTGGQGWYDLALAVNPTNAEMLYVGGVNIWKSTNGGTSWNINSHWYGGCGVPAVHADCHYLTYSPNGNLFATVDGGLWTTSNGGTTWTDKTVTMTIGQIYKLGVAQTLRDKVINGFQDNGTYTFTPTGWLATGGGDGMECAIDYTNPSYTYHTIYYGDIFRKYNNTSEVKIAGNGTNGITESGAWVTPFILSKSNHRSMFVGYKNVWRASNVLPGGSVHFDKISDNLAGSNGSDMAVLEHCSADSNILYAARSDNKLFRTDNCLANPPTWINLSPNLPASQIVTSLASHPTDPNIIYMSQGTKIYKSTTQGTSWTDISGNLPNIHISTIAFYRNADEGLYVGTDAGVYYKDQHTNSWIIFSQGLPDNGRVTELEIFYDNDSVSRDAIYASTYGRGLWGSDMYHAPVDADFTTSSTTIPTGCSIDFKDLSAGVPTFWSWTFTGGTPSTSNQKNPSGITYSAPGTYTVKLKCWNEFAQDSVIKTNYITVSSALLPQVNFISDKQALCLGDTVYFTDMTQNCPNAWSWQFTPNTVTFINGTSSTDPNPVVLFNNPGPYDVKLSALNNNGQGSLTKSGYIVNGGYNTPFSEDFGGGFSAHYWTVVNPEADITWDTITVPGLASGSKAAWLNFYNYTVVNKRDQLISPPLRMSQYPPLELTFKHAYAQRIPIKDSLIVKISEDCGLTWKRLLAVGPDGSPQAFVTSAPTNNPFIPLDAGEWCAGTYGVNCYSIDLYQYIGQSNIRFMFESFNRNGNNLYISDIRVQGEVGIEENSLNLEGLTIYPNPSHGLFTLECRQCSESQHLSILSTDGIIVYSRDIPENGTHLKETLDFSSLPKGIYLVRLTSQTSTRSGKLILN